MFQSGWQQLVAGKSDRSPASRDYQPGVGKLIFCGRICGEDCCVGQEAVQP